MQVVAQVRRPELIIEVSHGLKCDEAAGEDTDSAGTVKQVNSPVKQ
jgi:hypothetical protein